ncbi:hydrophobin family protein [Streptomyces sp. NPDC049555]|uniref:hydrophobin family protein n=1 Tax=Streptomyces sp. NPDC049555 TaxID=3154930 RepID=UPI0034484878
MNRLVRARVVTAVSALALTASATVITVTTSTPAHAADQTLCCDQSLNANSAAAQHLGGLLGTDVSRTAGMVGVQCRALDAFRATGNCNGAALTCAHSNLDGFIATGCRPARTDL